MELSDQLTDPLRTSSTSPPTEQPMKSTSARSHNHCIIQITCSPHPTLQRKQIRNNQPFTAIWSWATSRSASSSMSCHGQRSASPRT